MSHFTVNYMDMRYLATLLARGPQAMSSITRMSSQLYMPHYLVIRSAAPCKAPVQRRRAAILRRRGQSQPGVDYWARKSALIRSSGFPADLEERRPEREAADKHEAEADGGDTSQRPDLRRRRGG